MGNLAGLITAKGHRMQEVQKMFIQQNEKAMSKTAVSYTNITNNRPHTNLINKEEALDPNITHVESTTITHQPLKGSTSIKTKARYKNDDLQHFTMNTFIPVHTGISDPNINILANCGAYEKNFVDVLDELHQVSLHINKNGPILIQEHGRRQPILIGRDALLLNEKLILPPHVKINPQNLNNENGLISTYNNLSSKEKLEFATALNTKLDNTGDLTKKLFEYGFQNYSHLTEPQKLYYVIQSDHSYKSRYHNLINSKENETSDDESET